MARAIWQGEVVFGQVRIQVRLEGAVQNKEVKTHLVHREDHGKLHAKRFCEKCGREIEWKDTARVVEVGNREVVDFEPEELKELRPERDSELVLSGFTDPSSVDPVYFDRAYVLMPVGKQPRAFELLAHMLRQSGKIGVMRANLSGRSHPAILRPRGAELVLHTLHAGDEVRDARVRPDPKLRPGSREMALAEQLVERMALPFDPSTTEDPYRHAVEEIAAGRKPRPIDEAAARRKARDQDKDVLDLTAALQQSLKEGARAKGKQVTRRAARTATSRQREAAPKAQLAKAKEKASATKTPRRHAAG